MARSRDSLAAMAGRSIVRVDAMSGGRALKHVQFVDEADSVPASFQCDLQTVLMMTAGPGSRGRPARAVCVDINDPTAHGVLGHESTFF